MKCPRCKGKNTKRHHRLYECQNCRAMFDPTDDGNYHSDPTKRIRLEESRVERRKQLKGGL